MDWMNVACVLEEAKETMARMVTGNQPTLDSRGG